MLVLSCMTMTWRRPKIQPNSCLCGTVEAQLNEDKSTILVRSNPNKDRPNDKQPKNQACSCSLQLANLQRL